VLALSDCCAEARTTTAPPQRSGSFDYRQIQRRHRPRRSASLRRCHEVVNQGASVAPDPQGLRRNVHRLCDTWGKSRFAGNTRRCLEVFVAGRAIGANAICRGVYGRSPTSTSLTGALPCRWMTMYHCGRQVQDLDVGLQSPAAASTEWVQRA
jgi:hypothetical protein